MLEVCFSLTRGHCGLFQLFNIAVAQTESSKRILTVFNSLVISMTGKTGETKTTETTSHDHQEKRNREMKEVIMELVKGSITQSKNSSLNKKATEAKSRNTGVRTINNDTESRKSAHQRKDKSEKKKEKQKKEEQNKKKLSKDSKRAKKTNDAIHPNKEEDLSKEEKVGEEAEEKDMADDVVSDTSLSSYNHLSYAFLLYLYVSLYVY